jgi:hypothetical protein
MTKLLVELPDVIINSLNEIADFSKKSTNDLIIDIMEKLVSEYQDYRIALDRLADDAGVYRDPPPRGKHLPKITISPTFKITET